MLKRMTSVLRGHGPLDVAESMASLILLSKNSTACLLWPLCVWCAVPEQVRQHLEEVRLAGAEEAGNPDADLAGGIGILAVVDGFAIGREELAEVLVKFPGDDELVQFLPDEESSSWSAFTTPLMGRKMSLLTGS